MITTWLANWFILSVSVFVVTRNLAVRAYQGVRNGCHRCFRLRNLEAIAYEYSCFPFVSPHVLDVWSCSIL